MIISMAGVLQNNNNMKLRKGLTMKKKSFNFGLNKVKSETAGTILVIYSLELINYLTPSALVVQPSMSANFLDESSSIIYHFHNITTNIKNFKQV